MRRWLAAGILVLAAAGAAYGLDQVDVPPQFPIPWGNSAGSNYIRNIPEASQIGSQNCAASLTDGFPPLTFTPSSQGGCPPFGQDMNGVLKQLSQWSRWQGAGAHPIYDSSFSASIGGYPSGAILANAATTGCFWVSTVDDNASNPDTGGANWNASCPGGGVGSTSGGSANAQTVTATGFVLKRGQQLTFTAGFTNTGLLRVNPNGTGNVDVYRRTQLGAGATVGGEVVAGQMVQLIYDGTNFQCQSCDIVKVGTSIDFRGATLPGTLAEDGSCVSQTTYANLFTVIGTTYGSCSAGLFALPDSRGRVNVGNDGSAGRVTAGGAGCAGNVLGTGCGSQNRTLVQSQLPNVVITLSGTQSLGHTTLSGTGAAIAPDTSSGPAQFQTPGAGATYQTTEFFQFNDHVVDFSNATASSINSGGTSPIITLQPTLIVTRVIQF